MRDLLKKLEESERVVFTLSMDDADVVAVGGGKQHRDLTVTGTVRWMASERQKISPELIRKIASLLLQRDKVFVAYDGPDSKNGWQILD